MGGSATRALASAPFSDGRTEDVQKSDNIGRPSARSPCEAGAGRRERGSADMSSGDSDGNRLGHRRNQ
jgi:hypothetical protein